MYANQALFSLNKQLNAIQSLMNKIALHEKDFAKLIDLLKPVVADNYKSRLIITGVGKNANLATKASETFASLGIPSMYLNSCHYSHGDSGFIGPNDIVIHVSKSGKTQEMVYAASHLRKIRPKVIQILLCCDETKNETFDYIFSIGKIEEADDNGLAPTSSSTVLLALLDTIGVILSSMVGFKPEHFYAFHPGGSLGKKLERELCQN